MTLNNNLYRIQNIEKTETGFCVAAELCRESVIYQAHFPGMPITPGVCLLQMAAEMLGEALGKSLMLTGVKNAKFLSVVTPDEELNIVCRFSKIAENDNGEVSTTTTIQGVEGELRAKLSITCQTVS